VQKVKSAGEKGISTPRTPAPRYPQGICGPSDRLPDVFKPHYMFASANPRLPRCEIEMGNVGRCRKYAYLPKITKLYPAFECRPALGYPSAGTSSSYALLRSAKNIEGRPALGYPSAGTSSSYALLRSAKNIEGRPQNASA